MDGCRGYGRHRHRCVLAVIHRPRRSCASLRHRSKSSVGVASDRRRDHRRRHGLGRRARGPPGRVVPMDASRGASVAANAIHAVVAADADVPPVLAASVAAVPPLVLLAITHLTVVLTQKFRPDRSSTASAVRAPSTEVVQLREPADVPVKGARRDVAALMRQRGMSNKEIASATGVHPSTVGRWFAGTLSTPDLQKGVTP